MSAAPRLILVYGAVGSGKTTLAERFSRDQPMTLCLEGDVLMSMVSGWLTHEPKVRTLVFDYALQMIKIHLQAGHDVIMPYLLVDADQATRLESYAQGCGARFIEILLDIPKETSVKRVLKRGSWGEPGSPPVTEGDRPTIEGLYDQQAHASAVRPNIRHVLSIDNQIEATYEKFLAAVG